MSVLEQILIYLRSVIEHVAVDENTMLADVLHEDTSKMLHEPSRGEVMHLIVWIEQTFGFEVEIDDINPDHFWSPATLAAYIEPRKQS